MDKYRVKPGAHVKLGKFDASDTSYFPDGKKSGLEKQEKLHKRLEELQELLYAEHRHKLLIVLQAMDSGGKDGTIRHVFEGVNPQGVKVASFKKPAPIELDHDYLWRIHQEVPPKGDITIFNRSHYEDVLVVRVHQIVPEKVWSKRFDHINNFEQMLADEGTIIIKFFLHIDEDEQKKRLVARLEEDEKHWKFTRSDIEERRYWNDYMRAYEDLFAKTSTPWAPWYIVPANHKWYRNLVVSTVIVEALERLDMRYPEPEKGLEKIKIK